MLKTLFYLGLGIAGLVAALINPVWGAIAVMEAYLFSPHIFSPQLSTIRFQFFITIAFVLGMFLHGTRSAPKVGKEGMTLWLLDMYESSQCSSFWQSSTTVKSMAAMPRGGQVLTKQ